MYDAVNPVFSTEPSDENTILMLAEAVSAEGTALPVKLPIC
jgi:hypothetical protein